MLRKGVSNPLFENTVPEAVQTHEFDLPRRESREACATQVSGPVISAAQWPCA